MTVVAYRVNDKLPIGAPVNAMRGAFKTVVGVNNAFGPDGQLTLDDKVGGRRQYRPALRIRSRHTPTTRRLKSMAASPTTANSRTVTNIPPAIPANATWRFGFGGQIEESKTFNWGLSAEYVYAGSLKTNLSGMPSVIGGRGNLAGSYDQPAGILFLAANFNFKF